jgi:hypothetical protein
MWIFLDILMVFGIGFDWMGRLVRLVGHGPSRRNVLSGILRA